MTLDRLVDDAIDLTEQTLRRLNKDKLVLVGQSAGSVLGLKAALKRPDLFHAFVAAGSSSALSVPPSGKRRRPTFPPLTMQPS